MFKTSYIVQLWTQAANVCQEYGRLTLTTAGLCYVGFGLMLIVYTSIVTASRSLVHFDCALLPLAQAGRRRGRRKERRGKERGEKRKSRKQSKVSA